jgi:DNA-binding GntR family transcriptional regulator
MAVKEIVLSEQVTGLSRHIRQRAINNLVKRGLIRVRRGKGKAVRVVDLYI